MLGTGTGTLQSGNAAVSACQSTGFTFTNSLSGSKIASVNVGGVTAACATGTLTLNVTSTTGTSLGAGTAAIPSSCSGCSVSVTLSPSPTAANVVADSLAVAGP